MSSKSAAHSESLLDELQTTLAHGTVARRVGGISLSTKQVSTPEWIEELVSALAEQASLRAAARTQDAARAGSGVSG